MNGWAQNHCTCTLSWTMCPGPFWQRLQAGWSTLAIPITHPYPSVVMAQPLVCFSLTTHTHQSPERASGEVMYDDMSCQNAIIALAFTQCT